MPGRSLFGGIHNDDRGRGHSGIAFAGAAVRRRCENQESQRTMRRFKILHRTYYNFSDTVQLGPHTLRLRPIEGHELRIESSSLDITPAATLRWHSDVEDNSVAIATFDTPTQQLVIESEIIIQQFNEAPLDFLVDAYAADYPFAYEAEDSIVLAPYLLTATRPASDPLAKWVASLWRAGEPIQTYALLQRLCVHISQSFILSGARAARRSNARRHPVARHRLLPRFCESVHRSRASPGPRRAFCQRLPLCGAVGRQLRLDPCLGRSVPAGCGLERLRSHHRQNRRDRSHRRRRGTPARVRAARSRLVRRPTRRKPRRGSLGHRAEIKIDLAGR